jgi:hypothetical protein
MSYGRVNKPRFFPDAVNWLASRGWSKESYLALANQNFTAGSTIYQLFDLNPLNTATIDTSGESGEAIITIDFTVTANMPITFVAILNHNLNTAASLCFLQSDTAAITDYDALEINSLTPLIGCTSSVGGVSCAADGDLIATCTATNERYHAIVLKADGANFADDITIGSIIVGSHYTLPNSGDLNVQRDFSFDGVTVRSTDGGKRYGHASWVAGNDGNNYAPFRSQSFFRRPGGRQAYDINFSYIADTELFGDDLSANGTETDFYYQVPNKTAGPLLPFIWTPDSTSTTEGDYLFARLMNDFKPQKVANRVWSFKNRIEEEL